MAQTRPSPTLSRGFTRLGRFLAPYAIAVPPFRSIVSISTTNPPSEPAAVVGSGPQEARISRFQERRWLSG